MCPSDFCYALNAMLAGHKVQRAGWNGKGMWVALQKPDQYSKMQRPYIYISTAQGELVPWVASHGDLLANDWRLFVQE